MIIQSMKPTIALHLLRSSTIVLTIPHIDLAAHKFTVHLETGDNVVTTNMIEDYTQVPSNPHHSEPFL